MYKNLLDYIKSYDKITIFRHCNPDGDCVFSQLALYTFLKDNFKYKQIKVCGFEKYDLICKNDKVSNAFIKESLAFALDTSNIERIDDKRIELSSKIIVIDHHPQTRTYGDINIIKANYASTSEILAEILLSKQFNEYTLSDLVCKYLYCGIIADTINFKTNNTTAKTLEIACKIAKKGNLEISNLVNWIFNINLNTFNQISQIRNYLKTDNKFGYILLNKKDLNKINISSKQAKNNIDVIGNINELNVWAFAVENDGKYDCSVRAKKGYIINKICQKYGGGGHSYAAATKNMSFSNLKSMFKELIELSTKKALK